MTGFARYRRRRRLGRVLADFLEANPAVPIPRHGHTFGVSTSGSDEQKRSQVKFAGLAAGEDVTDDTQDGQLAEHGVKERGSHDSRAVHGTGNAELAGS